MTKLSRCPCRNHDLQNTAQFNNIGDYLRVFLICFPRRIIIDFLQLFGVRGIHLHKLHFFALQVMDKGFRIRTGRLKSNHHVFQILPALPPTIRVSQLQKSLIVITKFKWHLFCPIRTPKIDRTFTLANIDRDKKRFTIDYFFRFLYFTQGCTPYFWFNQLPYYLTKGV